MAVETERHIAQTGPEREAVQSSRIERILPEELHPRVGDPTEKIKLLTGAFPEALLNASMDIVKNTPANVVLKHIIHSDPPETLEVSFVKPDAEKTFEIHIDGPLERFMQKEVPRGLPLVAEFKDQKTICTALRKVNPQAEEPIAAEGKILQPGDTILILEKGKKTRWDYTLPKDKFPKGGRVTAITIPDVPGGFQIKHGDIIGYIEPIK